MKSILKASLMLVILFTSSCEFITQFMCPLEDTQKKMVETVNKEYKNQLTIEHIPCEFISINVFLHSEEVDTSLIQEVHMKLLNQGPPMTGWQSINVHDDSRSYLFTHHYSGNISPYMND